MNYKEKRVTKIKKLFPIPVVRGKGLINSVINNLPFEAHLPGGYKYAGPGTKLAQKLEKGVKPKNKLDEAAMYHDIVYTKSNNLADRHNGDKQLEYAAWDRVKAKDASLGEKTNAWLVTNAMKLKRALGAGVKRKLPGYVKHPVNLDNEQVKELATATKPVTLHLKSSRERNSVMNQTYLPLMEAQVKKVKKRKSISLRVVQLK